MRSNIRPYVAIFLIIACVSIQGCGKDSENKIIATVQTSDPSEGAAEIAKEEAWLQKHSWEIVTGTVPLMRGATVTFAPGIMVISGSGVNVQRSFQISRQSTVNGRTVYDIKVDSDDLLLMISTETVPGTDSFTMTWGNDGSGALGLGRRSQ